MLPPEALAAQKMQLDQTNRRRFITRLGGAARGHKADSMMLGVLAQK
jgi:hypothetical protein